MRALAVICASILLLMGARAAQAQQTPPVGAAAPVAAGAPFDLTRIRSPFALTEAQAAMLRAGIATTAVDHRFADRLTGSLGFLCGLHGETYQGAAAMRGSDPDGRFLGAKLSLAFR